MVPTIPSFFPAEGWYFFNQEKYGAFKPLVEKVEGTERINVCIERVFGYKARVNRMFLNISRWLEITERERNELLLFVKNSHELGSNPFPYIALVIPRPLSREVVGGEHVVLTDLLKSISGSSSQAGSAREPQAEIAERALVSGPDQSPLREQDSQAAPQVVKRNNAQAESHFYV